MGDHVREELLHDTPQRLYCLLDTIEDIVEEFADERAVTTQRLVAHIRSVLR